MPSAWSGRVMLLPGAMLYAGPLGPTSPHQHHALQIVLAPDGIELAGPETTSSRYTAAMIAANSVHTIVSAVPEGRLLLIDPESSHHRRVSHLVGQNALRGLDVQDAAPIASLLESSISRKWLEEVLQRFGDASAKPKALHPGVRRVQAALVERLDRGDIDLASLAHVAGLSEGRLGHAFREQVGLPIRPYVLWLRLQRAAMSLGQGRSITEAAHESGFADSSHLSRTFRRMFGLAPSDVAGWVEWLNPDEEHEA